MEAEEGNLGRFCPVRSGRLDRIPLSEPEWAKYFPANSRITLDEISDSLGFGTRSYFTSVFKKHTGQTPSEYRREHSLV